MIVDLASDCAPAAGERESGDALVIQREPERSLLVVIDVLGHGAAAAEVARQAQATFTTHRDLDPCALMAALHAQLRGTRGAAAAICVVANGEIASCSVGNVETRLAGGATAAVARPGIVGVRLPALLPTRHRLRQGDRLAMWSDGISSRASLSECRTLSAAATCAHLMSKHRRGHDDASVIVADVEQPRPSPQAMRNDR